MSNILYNKELTFRQSDTFEKFVLAAAFFTTRGSLGKSFSTYKDKVGKKVVTSQNRVDYSSWLRITCP